MQSDRDVDELDDMVGAVGGEITLPGQLGPAVALLNGTQGRSTAPSPGGHRVQIRGDLLVVSAAVVAVLVAAAWDWRRGEIPDFVPLWLLATGVLGAATGASTLSWGGLTLGFGVGVALGIAGFRWALLGGGDAKLLAGLGAALGPAVLVGALVYASPCLALMAWRARRRGESDLPLAPCLAIGLFLALAAGGGALLVPHR